MPRDDRDQMAKNARLIDEYRDASPRRRREIMREFNVREDQIPPIVYIDGSGSTTDNREYFDRLGRKSLVFGWKTFEFSSKVKPFVPGLFTGEGTMWWNLIKHVKSLNTCANIFVFTDDDPLAYGCNLQELRDLNVQVIPIRNRTDFNIASLALAEAAAPLHRMHRMKADLIRNLPEGSVAFLDEFYNSNTSEMFGPITLRPQEAPMSGPTIVTNVSLQNNGNTVTVADLKRLITEVERVGGDDTSAVKFDQNYYRWDVALSVKANEVEAEVTVTDEERLALLDEYTTATKTRKAEIKKTLGL